MYATISNIISSLRITDSLTVGEILHSKGLYSNLHSARVNAQKALNGLADLGQIEKCKGYYRALDCTSEYKEHARLLTKSLAKIIIRYNAVIFREISIPEIGLRPDAIVLLKRDSQGLCFVLEVVNNESDIYLQSKINAWKNWEGALPYLSRLFGYRIPHFELITSDQLDSYLEGICEK